MIRQGKYKNWEEVTPIVNKNVEEEDVKGESGHRKSVKYARDFYEAGVFNKDEDSYMKELEIQKRELEKERQKLFSTKVEYTRSIRQQSRYEMFYENVRNAITNLPLPEFYPLFRELENTKKAYVLTIADIHAGARFISETNEYSLEICKKRFETLLGETIKFVQDKNLTNVQIVEMGDTVQGLLRLSDLQINETSVVETTVFISRIIADFLNKLSSYCLIDYYHVPTSNHSQNRPLGTKASELATEDVEYVISNYIKDVLSNNNRVRVNLNYGKQYISIPILDYEAIAMHGHQIKNIKDSLKDLSMLHRKFYDFVFLAHFHGSQEVTVGESVVGDTEVLICPSFIGSDPYSDSLMKGSKASCKIFGFDYYNGHTETYKVILN